MNEIRYTAEQVEEMATKRADQAVREVIMMARAGGSGGASALKLSPKQQMMQRIFRGGVTGDLSNSDVNERIRAAQWH